MPDHIEDLSFASPGYLLGLLVLSLGILVPLSVIVMRNRKAFSS
jgi:hypothetical protein